MKEDKVLDEEKYKKAAKALKIAAIVVIVIGLCLIGFGVFNIVKANNMVIPKMDEGGWYDAKASQSSTQFAGEALCMFGVFITIGVGGMLLSIAYRRNILAFQTQQMMPVAKEGMEDIAPTAGHVGGEILKSMAHAYGDVAKEVASGIKEGLKEDTKVCKKCGTENTSDAEFCKKCGKKL